jgi:hypothetical protein
VQWRFPEAEERDLALKTPEKTGFRLIAPVPVG